MGGTLKCLETAHITVNVRSQGGQGPEGRDALILQTDRGLGRGHSKEAVLEERRLAEEQRPE